MPEPTTPPTEPVVSDADVKAAEDVFDAAYQANESPLDIRAGIRAVLAFATQRFVAMCRKLDGEYIAAAKGNQLNTNLFQGMGQFGGSAACRILKDRVLGHAKEGE